MSHFPCLEKNFINDVLTPHGSQIPDNWRDHLNSQILDKYLQIKRNQKQKIAQILPRYHIFPKNFNTYNIYTNQYELDRLQRINYSSNPKYVQQPKSKTKKGNSQQPDDMVFGKSASQVFAGTSSFYRQPAQQHHRSAIKFHDSKSTKSLTETQISPSKLSKQHNRKNPSKHPIQSDSQLSGQRHKIFRESSKQVDKKSWTSNGRSQKNGKVYKDDHKMFSNAESAITVVKREANGRRNQGNEDYYYGPERGNHSGNYWTAGNQRQGSTRRRSKSPKNLLYYHSQNEYDLGRNTKKQQQSTGRQYYDQRNISNRNQKDDDSNYYIESPFNPRYQQSQIQKNRFTQRDVYESQFDGNTKGIKSEITRNETYEGLSNGQRRTEQQRQGHKYMSNSNSIFADLNQQDLGKINSNPRANSNKNQPQTKDLNNHRQEDQNNHHLEDQNNHRFDPRNTFAKQPTVDNETQISNIQDKLLEYYGDEFERIKAERDYLRKNFIEHLEKHHSDKLPYKHLTEIKLDETGKKLIISQKSVPFSKQQKDNQVFHAQLVEHAQKKKKK